MIDFGTVRPGTTLYIPFATYDSNDPSASVTLTGLATTDIEIYKDGSTTQRASDAGYALLDTDGIDFDTTTGIHGFSIDLADNTTAGFYAAGSQYWVVVASVTVDAATINFIAATFRIGYPDAVLNTTIATLSTQTSFTLTAGPAEDDALNGCIVRIHDVASAVQAGFAVVQDYTGSTKTVTLVAGTTFTAAATDNIAFYPPALVPTVLGRTLDVASGGEAGVDFSNINGTLDAAEIGTGAITSAKFAAGAIDAAAIANGAIDAATFAADVDAEILSYIVDDATRIDASQLNTHTAITAAGIADAVWDEDIVAAHGTADTAGLAVRTLDNAGAGLTSIPWNAAWDAEVESEVDDALGGGTGTALTAIPWNAAWDAEVQSEVTDGLNAYDPPTRAEATADKDEILAYLNGLVIAKGTIGSTGNSTTALHLTGLTYGDDEINNYLLAIKDVSAGEWHARYITDWADTGDLATVATLPFTPENAVDIYVILAFRQDVTGGSGLDAAGVRAAIGMASANLDAQLTAIDDYLDTEVSAIKTVTDAIGATGTGLSAIPWNAAWDAEVQSEVDDALVAQNLDHLVKSAVDTNFATTVHLDSVIGHMVDAGTTATFDRTTDSAEALQAAIDTIDNFLDTEMAAVLADTNELQTDLTNGGRLDLLIDAILEDTGTTLQGELDGIQADTEDIQTRLPAALVGGRIDATVDGTGMESGAVTAILTSAMTESYNTDGSTMTVAQALYLIAQRLTEFSISGTTITIKKLDGTTTAATLTLDDGTSPTSSTRAT